MGESGSNRPTAVALLSPRGIHLPLPSGDGFHILLAEDNAEPDAGVRCWKSEGTMYRLPRRTRALEKSDSGLDLVLMDVQMPVMGGFEATAAVRETEKSTGKHIPIVP